MAQPHDETKERIHLREAAEVSESNTAETAALPGATQFEVAKPAVTPTQAALMTNCNAERSGRQSNGVAPKKVVPATTSKGEPNSGWWVGLLLIATFCLIPFGLPIFCTSLSSTITTHPDSFLPFWSALLNGFWLELFARVVTLLFQGITLGPLDFSLGILSLVLLTVPGWYASHLLKNKTEPTSHRFIWAILIFLSLYLLMPWPCVRYMQSTMHGSHRKLISARNTLLAILKLLLAFAAFTAICSAVFNRPALMASCLLIILFALARWSVKTFLPEKAGVDPLNEPDRPAPDAYLL